MTLACVPGHAVASMGTGLAEQNAAMFASPAFAGLGVSHVRVVVPWDAALTDDERSREWIETALASGAVPLVAFDKSRGVECPGATCVAPTEAQYESGVAAFRARWPRITTLTPWNEPNHVSQPTYPDRALAARYYNAARRVCPGCRLVAGDFLDDANLSAWLVDYRAALTEEPALWGLHNYFDATYFSSKGVDTMLRGAPGELWLTETGGIVRFGTLAHDERRAADSIRWLYTMTRGRPRVARMYLYHWQGSDQAAFDGGLIAPDGRERPGLAVVREEMAKNAAVDTSYEGSGGRGGSQPPAGGSGVSDGGGKRVGGQAAAGDRAAVRVRLSGKGLRRLRRGLEVGVACVAAPSRCSGRLAVRLPRKAARGAPLRVGMRFDLRPGQSVVRVLRLSGLQRAALGRSKRLRVTFCVAGAARCRTRHAALVAPRRK